MKSNVHSVELQLFTIYLLKIKNNFGFRAK